MPEVATSLHLHNVHELHLLIPLKRGFVEQPERRISYGTRLERLLGLLFRGSQSTAEKTLMPVYNFSDGLRNIYHFDYGVVRRYQRSELFLSATFDSSWESYFENLVYHVGDFLDAVFFHCEGFKGRSCVDGYDAFADFIREHQVQAGVLYTATPDLTTDDLRLLGQYAKSGRVQEPFKEDLKEQIQLDKAEWTERYQSDAWQGGAEYARLRAQSIKQFFLTAWETRKLFSKEEQFDAKRNARQMYENATVLLAESLYREIAEFPKDVVEGLKASLAAGPEHDERKDWIEQTLQQAGKRDQRGPRAAAPREVQPDRPNLANIQDGIVSPSESDAAYLAFLRLPTKDPAGFLSKLQADLKRSSDAWSSINVGFTFAGLRRIGLGNETLELFPKEFQEGMELRSGHLGDIGWPSHPQYWRPLGAQGWFSMASIDLVVVVHFGAGVKKLEAIARAERLLGSWLSADEFDTCVVHTEAVDRPDVDPFGLRRARTPSQPAIRAAASNGHGAASHPGAFDNSMALGDLILGYRNGRGELSRSVDAQAGCKELFQDGTFLVVRKLAQNTAAYRQALSATGATEAASLGPEMAPGRSYDAKPESDYSRTSHRRRTNPRSKLGQPRIVRQSYTYTGSGDDASEVGNVVEQGHMFMCYNASIAQQFEIIQRWINGGNSTGVLSTKPDLVAGQHVTSASPASVPNVTLRWGMYLFVPSIAAIGRLAAVASSTPKEFVRELRAAENDRRIARGEKLIDLLTSMHDKHPIQHPDDAIATNSWKQLFEEPGNIRDAQAVWAAVRRKYAGRLETPYGVLIGTREGAVEVLHDTGRNYSVCKYHERFQNVGGNFYLGLDDDPIAKVLGSLRSNQRPYRALAQANTIVKQVLSSDAAYATARTVVKDHLRKRSMFDVQELARHVVGEISAHYIGLPSAVANDPDARSKFLENFVNITRYSSFPFPEAWVEQQAIASGRALLAAYGNGAQQYGELARELRAQKYGNALDVRDAVMVANIGFVPPALSMLGGMLTKWLNNGDIEQSRLRDRAAVKRAIIDELKHDPTFTTIYRTPVEGQQDKCSIVGLQSAFEDDEQKGGADAARWMFGGTYGDPGTDRRGAHACPMQAQAIEILAGVVTAVADHVYEQAHAGRALVRLSGVAYEFAQVKRTLPGAYFTNASEGDNSSESLGLLITFAVITTIRDLFNKASHSVRRVRTLERSTRMLLKLD